MSEDNSTAPLPSGKPNKPSKPYPDFPLTAHPAGYWCKKIRGKLHYFGKWDDPDAALKSKLSKRNGPARMSTVVQVIRCAFKHAYESGKTDRPMRFGPAFKRTSKKTLRLHRAKQGAKLFTADEVRRLIGAAGTPLK